MSIPTRRPWCRKELIVAFRLYCLHPGHSDLPFICKFKGIPYDELIRRIVASALSRATQQLAGNPGVPRQ